MIYEIAISIMSVILLITGAVNKKHWITVTSCLLMLFSVSSILMTCLFSVKYLLTTKIFIYSIFFAVTVAVIFSFVDSKNIQFFLPAAAIILSVCVCVIANSFIGVTYKTCNGKDYAGIYVKITGKGETVVTYYEVKGFMLVSSEYCFKENYGVVTGGKDEIFDREPYETEVNPNYSG